MPEDQQEKLTLDDIKDWKKLENSSAIKEIMYDKVKKILKVKFAGDREYHYENITPNMIQKFLDSESKGQYFHKTIRKSPEKYPFKRVAAKLSRENFIGRTLAKQMMSLMWQEDQPK